MNIDNLPITNKSLWHHISQNPYHLTFKYGDEVIFFSNSKTSLYDFIQVTTHDIAFNQKIEGIRIIWYYNVFKK